MIWTFSSQRGYSPRSIASNRSFDAWPSSFAWISAACAAVSDSMPCRLFQWYLTSTPSPAALTIRYVLTPKPSWVR